MTTVKEASVKLNVSPKTVRRYIKTGKNGVRLNVNAKHGLADFVRQTYYTKTGEESRKALEILADEYQI